MAPVRAIHLDAGLQAELRDMARAAYPREMCGLLVHDPAGLPGVRYVQMINLAAGGDRFEFDARQWAGLEDHFDILAVVHSHCDGGAEASEADLRSMRQSGLPWLIVSWPRGEVLQYTPPNLDIEAKGRVFEHGGLDCYATVRDHFARRLGLTLPDFHRSTKWWRGRELDLYRDNFAAAGFVCVAKRDARLLREHDVVLMRVQMPPDDSRPNHAAVYTGDGKILHHLFGQLSREDSWHEWDHCATHLLRHRSLVEAA